jgi:hypothetical protein
MGELIRAQLPQYYIGSEEYAHEQLARLCMCYMSLVGHPRESVKKNPHRPVSSQHLRYPLM